MELLGRAVLRLDIKTVALVRSAPNIFIGNKLESFRKAIGIRNAGSVSIEGAAPFARIFFLAS